MGVSPMTNSRTEHFFRSKLYSKFGAGSAAAFNFLADVVFFAAFLGGDFLDVDILGVF
jgi:hypothetical protein